METQAFGVVLPNFRHFTEVSKIEIQWLIAAEQSSERHLWKPFGCRWAELPSGSVSLFLLRAALLPAQLLQLRASDEAGKSHGRVLVGRPIPQLHTSSHGWCSLEVTHAQRVPAAAPGGLGSWATRIIEGLRLPYPKTQTMISSCHPCSSCLDCGSGRERLSLAPCLRSVMGHSPVPQCPNHVMTWWIAGVDSGDFFLCRAPRYRSATIGFI